ncbi:hypothetical protein BDD12DRAFT_905414 [Trichophaea hybrida]|nr:hypothetical protein BDD12DRAFT_905414 [Trichophaea hybrida]
MVFVTLIGQCSALLGVTLDVRPSDIRGKIQVLDDDEQRAAAVVAADECTNNGILECLLPAAESRREYTGHGSLVPLWTAIGPVAPGFRDIYCSIHVIII